MNLMDRPVDWNEVWKEMHGTDERTRKKDRDPGSYWDGRAESYDRVVADEEGEASVFELALMDLLPQDHVLDMGAGTGRLAVPMAARVAHVTALDPSTQMLAYLRKNMEEKGLTNYRCVPMRWEDVVIGRDLGPCDVVVAAYSLGFYDLRGALEKLDAAAGRVVYLFWHAGEWRSASEQKLWGKVFGKENGRKGGYPDYIFIVNVLHDMGIYANVRIYSKDITVRYATAEEAAERWMRIHDVAEDMRGPVLRHFKQELMPVENGYLHFKRSTRAMIWWKKNTG
jgi:SAM-dependent methyltransferase